MADWNQLLNGSVQSVFTDGSPGGERTLRDGSTIDLSQVLNTANFPDNAGPLSHVHR